MHQPHADDPVLLVDAADYVTELRDEVEAQRGPVKPDAAREVFEMVVADPTLGAYVRSWARHRHGIEAKVGVVLHLPVDPIYRRLRAALLSAGCREGLADPRPRKIATAAYSCGES
jgi:hypothetical protein